LISVETRIRENQIPLKYNREIWLPQKKISYGMITLEDDISNNTYSYPPLFFAYRLLVLNAII